MSSALVKTLSRLSRSQLIDLALHWIDNPSTCAPYLASNRTAAEGDEEDYLFPPARSVRELRAIYKNLLLDEDSKGASSKTYVIDRIIDGDWRRGLSLYQHATIDFAHLSAHDTALRWQALRLVPLEHNTASVSTTSDDQPPSKKRKTSHSSTVQPLYPTVSPSTFLQTLRAQITPLIKAHYQLTTLSAPYNLPILRLYLTPNKPFNPHRSNIPRSARHAVDGGRCIYIALPQSSAHIYISVSGASPAPSTAAGAKAAQDRKVDITNMKRLIIEAIPKALSRRHERWALESTKLNTRSLRTICALRGGLQRPGTVGGAFAGFFSNASDASQDKDGNLKLESGPEPSPVDILARLPGAAAGDDIDSTEDEESQEENPMFFPEATTTSKPSRSSTKANAKLACRFGPGTHFEPDQTHRAKLDRLTARVIDVFHRAGEQERATVDCAPVTINFAGGDIVAGLRMLAALGFSKTNEGEKALDLDAMPGWMAGEEARSSVIV